MRRGLSHRGWLQAGCLLTVVLLASCSQSAKQAPQAAPSQAPQALASPPSSPPEQDQITDERTVLAGHSGDKCPPSSHESLSTPIKITERRLLRRRVTLTRTILGSAMPHVVASIQCVVDLNNTVYCFTHSADNAVTRMGGKRQCSML